MATRHLKRLMQEKESKKVATEAVTEGDEDSDAPDVSQSKPFNPFDLLTDSEKEEQEAPPSADESEQVQGEDLPSQSEVAQLTTNKQNKKKKQKKKKGKKAGQGEEAEEDGPGDKPRPKEQEEDLDAILEQFRRMNGESMPSGAGPSTSGGAQEAFKQAASTLLAIDIKHLQGDNELREIFGADVIEAVDRQDTAEQRRRGRAMAPRGAGRGRRPLKRSILVAAREHWPPLYDGLAMEYVGLKEGRQLFRYVHPPGYKSQQDAFDECQATHDPNNMAALLHRHPYQVDALLTMYELYRHMGENQYAEELLARALYALEMGWHPNFTPAAGGCILDFEVPENRALFTALFRHMQALTRQGLHRSALEVCKLLLALDKDDPMGALMYIDYIALRAGKYDYLQRFVAEFTSDTSLHLLPNFAFSLALAKMRQEEQRGLLADAAAARANNAGRTTKGTTAAGATEGGSNAAQDGSADDLLLQAVLLHPLTACQLVSKLQSQGAAKEAAWTALMARKLFAGATDGGSASLSHLVGLFVERSHLMWKAPEVLMFLLKACQRAADIADKKVQPPGPSAEDWACVRAQAFPPTPGNEFRHLRLAEFTDAINALPREELQQAMAAGGREDFEAALAELQEQVLLAQQGQQRPQGAGMNVSREELQNTHPLIMLLRSLLPWVNAGEQPDYAGDEQPQPQQQPRPQQPQRPPFEPVLEAIEPPPQQQPGQQQQDQDHPQPPP